MKRFRIVVIVLLIFIFGINSVTAQNPSPPNYTEPSNSQFSSIPIEFNYLYASAYTDLWHINPYNGEFTKIGPIGYQGTDIAFDGKDLYGINFTQLLSIDPTTGTGTVIGPIGFSGVNALTIAPDGIMYAGTTSGAFLKINKSTGAGTLIGYYGPGFGSSGDLAVRFDNKLFGTIDRSGYYTDWLAEIDIDTGKARPIGDIGENNVYGLDFKDWSLYGVTSSGHLLEINTLTGKSTQIATTSANFWGLSTSGPALTGNITSPEDNYSTGPASLQINATAEFKGGKKVNQVEFFVYHSGIWHSLGKDISNPYASGWETPINLSSQQALLRIDVVGTDNSNKLHRASHAGGIRHISYIESLGDPNITEVWLPSRSYLNQRSLSPDGDSKCNVSSIAMILAMDGYIDSDYLSMSKTANELAHYLLPNPGIDKECAALRDPVPSAYCSDLIGQSEAWGILKELIDAGHAVIVDSRPAAATSDGHYVTAVGYKESYGKHYIIAYDPYGEWQGSLNSYYQNSTGPASHVGKWVYYEFEKFTGSSVALFATISPTTITNNLEKTQYVDAIDLSAPDPISDELRVSVIFTGQETKYQQFIPMTIK